MQEALQAHLIDLETELLRADARRLDALLDEAFEEIGASGRTFGKADVLARLPAEAAPRFLPEAFTARMLAEGLAQLCYRLTIIRPGEAPTHSLRSSLWRRRGVEWRMVFHQGTPTQPHTGSAIS
ncbi:DUF4440 domain-containing protein [Chitinimonas sp.]|uniref:nuclear transport factor 2 family protein n=1 Tax=Chitinimonas sp. TaxID=1934313 RepID=UPI0035B3500A